MMEGNLIPQNNNKNKKNPRIRSHQQSAKTIWLKRDSGLSISECPHFQSSQSEETKIWSLNKNSMKKKKLQKLKKIGNS